MDRPTLSNEQQALVYLPPTGRVFLHGPAGCGKTTVGVERVLNLLEQGVPGHSILVLTPQHTLSAPYRTALANPALPPGSQVDVMTPGGLAHHMVRVFWPLVAAEVGFRHPELPPTFLDIESAQYHMARVARPLVQDGRFDTIAIDPNRLYTQILANLNSAATVGFPYQQIGQRLKGAWIGEPVRLKVYDSVQECATAFREYCLANNLVDFSLYFELFACRIWPSLLGREYLLRRYRHLIYDNVEEDFPVSHDIARAWLEQLESALLIYDSNAGYRSFLTADPDSGAALSDGCDRVENLTASLVTPDELLFFDAALSDSIQRRFSSEVSADIRQVVSVSYHPYLPDMMDDTCRRIERLVREDGIPPGEIAVLAPFLSDSLRFALANRLEGRNIPTRSHRPSRPLRDEPATRALLTLARLAHPEWGLHPSQLDLRYALMLSIDGLDLIRADLLAREVYRPLRREFCLGSFDRLPAAKRERITYWIGEKYEYLRAWINAYREEAPVELDIFLSRLFGELLSTRGYGFHHSTDHAAVAARLIDSVRAFRWSVSATPARADPLAIGKEYILMAEEGVLGSQFIQSWDDPPEDAVFLAPAHTFLMRNRPVQVQFWLDIGSPNWWQRLEQPLTHAHVLSRHWPPGCPWTDANEFQVNQQALARLTSGLIHRCTNRLHLCATGLSEDGSMESGQLYEAVNHILLQVPDLLEEVGHA